MKRLLGYGSLLAGGTLLALAAQPVYAAATVITGVDVIPTRQGAHIRLKTEAGDTPQVFAVNDGSQLRADLVRTQLQLPDSETFVQQRPAPGIAAVSLVPLDGNSVRLIIDGDGKVPLGTVTEADAEGIAIKVNAQPKGTPIPSTPVPANIKTVAGPSLLAQVDDPDGDIPVIIPEDEPEIEIEVEQIEGQPEPLIPNPEVTIDGVPIPAPRRQVPPFLPSAVPPPVGDISVSEIVPNFGEISLGTSERVPRLVLRGAPSREVLTLLARLAGLNVVFVGSTGDGDGNSEGPPVTLDIENESVQEVFNSVLRVADLQANRVGRTIYVGPELPISARNVMIRTLRMNQVDSATASNFLVGLGAERAVSRQRAETVAVATAADEDVDQDETVAPAAVEADVQAQRITFEDSSPILRGLQVVAEERTNSVTLVGSPELVDLATAQLVKIDLRKRQVAINLKVIDVDLNAIDAFGTSFSFATDSGDFSTSSQGGVGIFNFGGGSNPGGASGIPAATPIVPQVLGAGSPVSIATGLLGQLFATVSEGNAKVLTDPTLIVQEGQSARVSLTEEVVAEFSSDVDVSEDGSTTVTLDIETEQAGLVLQIDVDRIDDNGFVTLSVAPSITAPVDTVTVDIEGGIASPFVTLLSERELASGLIRVRDGQTLLLTGIIQETDRSEATKVPILGDLPLLGALFRSTRRENERLELIVMLTPQILDDSDQSTFGYSYTPSEEVQEILEGSEGAEE